MNIGATLNVGTGTMRSLHALVEQLESVIEESNERLEAAKKTIQTFEEISAANSVRHQDGSFTEQVISAIHEVLLTEGKPLHRRDILDRLNEQGIEFVGRSEPVKALAGYLHRSEASSVGNGMWDLVGRPKPEKGGETAEYSEAV